MTKRLADPNYSTRFKVKHGLYGTPEYRVWASMLARCRDKKIKAYGGKGIRVCEEWHSFERFITDMGNRPSAEHSIERKDNNLGYSKENCRWATKKEQYANRSRSILYRDESVFGKIMNKSEAAKRYGFKMYDLANKMNYHKLSIQESVEVLIEQRFIRQNMPNTNWFNTYTLDSIKSRQSILTDK